MTIATDPMTNAPIEAQVPDASASVVRFCSTCGTPWDATQSACGRCGYSPGASPESSSERAGVAGDSEAASIKSALGFYFALLSISLAMGLALVAQGDQRASVKWHVVADALLASVVVGWCIVQRRSILPVLARFGSIRWYGLSVAMAGFTFAVADLAVRFIQIMGGERLTYTDPFVAAGYGFWLPVLIVAVQPAIFEELAFRGSIQSSLQRVLKVREAIVVTTMMFAILHLSILSLPHLIALGLLLGWLRQASGSLYPAILLHFLHNLMALLNERVAGGILPW